MTAKWIIGGILFLSIVLPMWYYYRSKRERGNFKIAVGVNTLLFFGTILTASVLLFSGNAGAAEETAQAAQNDSWRFIAAALSTGMSCIGAGIAVASAASSALGALSEDSSIMGKALIFVALAESIALYGLLISFSILG
ncbi:MAG: ATP synthase subunit C [Lachnoclostridium sp.]|nr:ATP synthase subunit C [Lachnoclostridium sp.]